MLNDDFEWDFERDSIFLFYIINWFLWNNGTISKSFLYQWLIVIKNSSIPYIFDFVVLIAIRFIIIIKTENLNSEYSQCVVILIYHLVVVERTCFAVKTLYIYYEVE